MVATDPALDRKLSFLLLKHFVVATNAATIRVLDCSSLDPFSLALALNAALATFMLTFPHKLIGDERTISLDFKNKNQAEDNPFIKMSAI